MTDAEIIKALECCDFTDIKACEECPLYNTFDCSFVIIEKTLDLVNRQNSEIERLKQEINMAKCVYKELLSYKKALQTAKSEAIKEFAEELEYFVLNEDIEVVEPKCKDYESYINGANQFRHQIKNGINNIKERF